MTSETAPLNGYRPRITLFLSNINEKTASCFPLPGVTLEDPSNICTHNYPGMTREGDRMLRSQPLNIDQLQAALKAARRRGVRDSRLESHAPRFIELLYPAQRYPDLSIHQRAMAAENLIVAAVGSLDDQASHLLSILLCLTRDTPYSTLQRRREQAAEYVGVLPATWERGWREPQLLSDLAAKICRLHQQGASAYIRQPAQSA